MFVVTLSSDLNLGKKMRGCMSALFYWDLSKSPLCLEVDRRSETRAINTCSLPAKEFPCKPHQPPKIPWHVTFSFLLLILEAVTVTDSEKGSANTLLITESFQVPFNFVFNFSFHTFQCFQHQFLNPGEGSSISSLNHWLSDLLMIVFHNSSFLFLWKQFSIWGLGAESK